MARPALLTCGVHLDAVGPQEAAEIVLASAIAGGPAAFHLCNAYTLSLGVRDATFAALLDRGDHNFMDGKPLIWAARRKGLTHLERRVYGPTLMDDVLDRGRPNGLRHFLYGSTPEVLADLEQRLLERHPGLVIAGTHSPPWRDLTTSEEQEVAAAVAASGAQVVWIGLGTPRQDVFVDHMREQIPVPLVAVGAAFDFHAGRKRQAPAWMQDRGLEWLFRLLSEPKRLWRRYLIGNPVFLYGLARGVKVVERT